MVILLDLDGTLTNTAHEKFKPYKDGLRDFNVKEIPVFSGAVEFVKKLETHNHFVFIVSDSHPKYVKKIASEIFGFSCDDDSFNQVIWLADKPNIERTYNQLSVFAKKLAPHCPVIHFKSDKDFFLMIGDSWLDIELGRRLNIRTVLTQFYRATSVEERDGIGQDWKPIKMGPTYYVNNFNELEDVIENPNENLLALESVFQNCNSTKAVHFKYQKHSNGFMAFRCLARQNNGECDNYARGDMYYQIDNPNRGQEFLNRLSRSAENYINHILSFKQYQWDCLTYLTDKSTTTPPNKMKEIFDLIRVDVPKIRMFKWSDKVDGNLRNKPDYNARRDFLNKNLFLDNKIDIKDKSIIILDDQFTTSATAYYVSNKLKEGGAKNILFIALFYLILTVKSGKSCPRCQKQLVVKIRRSDGNRFYSCLSPQFGGQGCGYTENINDE